MYAGTECAEYPILWVLEGPKAADVRYVALSAVAEYPIHTVGTYWRGGPSRRAAAMTRTAVHAMRVSAHSDHCWRRIAQQLAASR
jgi:hypothetical protein